MTRLLLTALAATLLGLPMLAGPAAAQTGTPMTNQQPPLIDRDQFFGDPEIAGAQLSPDGQFIAFLKPFKGTRNIWVKRAEEPFEKARPVTADTKRPISSYFWTRDARFILFIQDQGGDENFNVYAVNPAESPAAGADVPKARNLTDAKGVRAEIFAVPKSDPDLIYVGINDRDKAWHDLYKVRISTGERTLMSKNTERLTGFVFDTKDQLRLMTRSAENGDTEILRLEPNGGVTKIYNCNVFETCAPVHFHKDGKRVYLETNKGADVDLVRLTLLDVQTLKEEAVESDPLKRVDLGGVQFSDLTDDLIATAYDDERVRYYWKDKGYEADYHLLEQKFPGREIALGSSTKDEQKYLISASSDVEPGETYLFNRKTKQLTLQYRIREQLPRNALSTMKAVKYPSSDGLMIPAYLSLPKGLAPKNLPAIVFPHGGPWARDSWGYHTFAQFLANRGYAVLMPNFRGSVGYGKKFLDAGNKQWGDKMQDDLTWGVKYLVAQGIADPKRVGIMGGSYGGYATLAGVTFTPDVYGAAVSIVGPSNLITLLESIPPYWEAGRKVFHERMGDPSTPQGRAQLERQSPLSSATKIRTPLMVIQGANDPRVNKRESDQIVVALRDRGFPVEYIVAPDEGHGFARPVNNLAAYAAAEKFLAAHLGGRYQQSMTPEVAERLKEITVDPKTVTLAKGPDPALVGVPKIAGPVPVGLWNYRAKVSAGPQTLEMAIQSTMKILGDAVEATDTIKSASGDATDTTLLDKATLTLRQRKVVQGPMTIGLEVKGNTLTGQMKMGEQARPISVELKAPLFADGAGAYQAIAALPLAPGYATQFWNLDMPTLKTKVMSLVVEGAENVTVQGIAYDTFRVVVSSDADGSKTTAWIDKDSRAVVKMTATSRQMNGATITTELIK